MTQTLRDNEKLALEERINDGFRYAYNGMCEVMQRQLIILNVFKGHHLNFRDLTLLDFFVQHGGDVGMPVSMHYPNPNRGMGYTVRINMIATALELLSASGVISGNFDDDSFRLESDLLLSADDLSSKYLKGICYAAEWLEERFANNREDIENHMDNRLKALKTTPVELPNSLSKRFNYLQIQYSLDYPRLEGLIESIVFQRELFESDFIIRTKDTSKLLPTKKMFDHVEAEAKKELSRIPAQYRDLTDLITSLDDRIDDEEEE